MKNKFYLHRGEKMSWKRLDGDFSEFEINEDGILRNVNTKHEFKKRQYSDGYMYYAINTKSQRKRIKVCELVAQAFIPNPNNKDSVLHKDGNKQNDNVSNLEWISVPDNTDEWEVIRDFPDYEINKNGDVRNIHTKRLIGLNPNQNGYLVVNLYKNKKPYRRMVHILVATQYIPNPENKPIVNHIDENRTHNSVDNLEWVTAKENAVHGTRGEKISSRRAKPLNEYDIYGKYIRTWVSVAAFARHYEIRPSPIFMCLRGMGDTAAGRQVRFYNGDLNDIEPVKNPGKYMFYKFTYDYEKEVPEEDLFLIKTEREQVMDAIDSRLKNIAASHQTIQREMELIKSYIEKLEAEVKQLRENSNDK